MSSLKYVILIGLSNDASNDLGIRYGSTGNNVIAETHYNLRCQYTHIIPEAWERGWIALRLRLMRRKWHFSMIHRLLKVLSGGLLIRKVLSSENKKINWRETFHSPAFIWAQYSKIFRDNWKLAILLRYLMATCYGECIYKHTICINTLFT